MHRKYRQQQQQAQHARFDFFYQFKQTNDLHTIIDILFSLLFSHDKLQACIPFE